MVYEIFVMKMKDAEQARKARAHAHKHYDAKGLISWQSFETMTNDEDRPLMFSEYMVWKDQESLEAGAKLFTTAEYTQEYLGLVGEMIVGRWLNEVERSDYGPDGIQ